MGEQQDPLTYAIIGAAIEVHKQLGGGFLEAVYHEALAIEFELRQIPFAHEKQLPVIYKSRRLSTSYRCDFLCYDEVIVELKAESKSSTKDNAQVINYLKASGHKIGLLLNFGPPSLEYKRLAN